MWSIKSFSKKRLCFSLLQHMWEDATSESFYWILNRPQKLSLCPKIKTTIISIFSILPIIRYSVNHTNDYNWLVHWNFEVKLIVQNSIGKFDGIEDWFTVRVSYINIWVAKSGEGTSNNTGTYWINLVTWLNNHGCNGQFQLEKIWAVKQSQNRSIIVW